MSIILKCLVDTIEEWDGKGGGLVLTLGLEPKDLGRLKIGSGIRQFPTSLLLVSRFTFHMNTNTIDRYRRGK